MMNNEHNPIAIRVGQIQDLWIQRGRSVQMQKCIA